MAGSHLPVLIDCDDGYGDSDVARTIAGDEFHGRVGDLHQDQPAPKRSATWRASPSSMRRRWRPSCARRRLAAPSYSIIARTDARAVRRPRPSIAPRRHLSQGGRRRAFTSSAAVDRGVARVGRTFQGVPQIANMAVVDDGHPDFRRPTSSRSLGFAIIPRYPPRSSSACGAVMEKALARSDKHRRLATGDQAVDFETFKDITGLARWVEISSVSTPRPAD